MKQTAEIYPPLSERELKNAAIAEYAAMEGMVLLENRNEALPLTKGQKLAMFGNGAVRTVLEESFRPLWLTGEVGSYNPYRSGHVYLTLKDASSQVRAVYFSGSEVCRRLGLKVNCGYYSQNRIDMLTPSNTVLEEAMSIPEPPLELTVRTILGSFLFKDDDFFKKVSVLSGGE